MVRDARKAIIDGSSCTMWTGTGFAPTAFADVLNNINVIHITEDFLAKLAEFMHRLLTLILSEKPNNRFQFAVIKNEKINAFNFNEHDFAFAKK